MNMGSDSTKESIGEAKKRIRNILKFHTFSRDYSSYKMHNSAKVTITLEGKNITACLKSWDPNEFH